MSVIDKTGGKLTRMIDLFTASKNYSLVLCFSKLEDQPYTIEIYADLIPEGFFYTKSTPYAQIGCGALLLHGSVNIDDATVENPDAINAVWINHEYPRSTITVKSKAHKK